ncbi:hypothetical protein AK812_SmicGene35145 [Symbiodinium microadriaticum]|uniref:Uncharacterized protein n=1 Tax=Symbiodinium microadriaticum TaxID=2951 RepID=A0A1Q9CM71_SYMMI|nr:hypothetical protein AK812_SmicGene35145 [Symbiodinium microadriaticum]
MHGPEIKIPVADTRRIEVVANGLLFWRGSQLAFDATIVSPLTRLGDARPRADVDPGSALAAAASHRHQTYPQLARAQCCRFIVAGVEIGGRFGTTLCSSGTRTLLSVAGYGAYAASLLELPPADSLCDGPVPELHDVLADARWD